MLDNQNNKDNKTEAVADKSPFAAPAISLPKGGGAIRGIGEKFAANPVTGTGSMTVPIATSPGRSGFGPQLNLSYDSGSGNGPSGFGWSLSVPSITRKTDKGLPQYLNTQESDVFILSGAEDLVPVFKKNADGTWAKDSLGKFIFDERTIGGYSVRLYRPRIEGLFARIERWTDSTSGDVRWRSISKDNILTLYGKDDNSRITDPDNAQHIFSWLICETRDDKGNAVLYEYKAEDGAGVDLSQAHERNRGDRNSSRRNVNRYLKHIRYGNRVSLLDSTGQRPRFLTQAQLNSANWMFQVVFDYGEHDLNSPKPNDTGEWLCRHDPFSSYRAGFEVRTYRLCQRVLMFHHFPGETNVGQDCLVRSTDFVYRNIRNNPDDLKKGHPIASFIASITQSGYKRRSAGGYLKKSLPPLEFEYSQVPSSDELAQLPVYDVDADSLENLPIGLDGSSYQWMDLDGEGTSGILTEQADGWYYKRNLSANHQITDNGHERTVAQFGPMEVVARKPVGGLSGGAQFLDLAGDGQVDLVQMEGPVRGFYERTTDDNWEPFKPFESWPNLNTRDPDLRFVDLTGDGHTDLLVTEDDVFVWYPSLAEDGFGPAERTRQYFDEEKGPRVVFNDGTESIYVADLSGDGLSDLVRIRNGEVCYWPNLGYGRFGARVTMDNAPWFDAPDQFDQRRIRLADIDGSGTTDILFLHREGVRIYFNQSGNRWSDAVALPQFPPIDNISSVQALDLLGNGTACLVWSSPLPGNTRRPMRYLALMEEKPHLLIGVKNNLGAETKVHYAPSTKFYLDDKRDGKPWITRLPFPVHVVERVETYDYISRNCFVTRYAYHHGYFDGTEREFRGFGMVEQWDTEEIGTLTMGSASVNDANWDAASFVPPVLTRTWFHTGAFIDAQRISKQFEHEYWREGDASESLTGLTDDQLRSLLLVDTLLPRTIREANGTRSKYQLSADEVREACRSLKGVVLRLEIYALDGTDASDRPYSVSERNYTIELLQPQNVNDHAVFFTHAREQIDFHYERILVDVNGNKRADPRVSHAMTLEADAFGNALRTLSIGYRRRNLPGVDAPEQKQTHITFTVIRVVNQPDESDWYHIGLPVETRTYEMVMPPEPTISDTFVNLFVFDDMLELTLELFPLDRNEPDAPKMWPYEKWDWRTNATNAPGQTRLRLIEHVRTLYRSKDLTGFLPFGTVESLALPGESYKLAFTPNLLKTSYVDTGKLSTNDVNNVFGTDGAYVHSEGDANWWIPSGRMFYSPTPNDLPASELAFARAHFFLPHRYRDPFGIEVIVNYDNDAATPSKNHNLLLVETKDALGNVMTVRTQDDAGNTAIRVDYRVLQPYWITDPNGNRTRVAFDVFGMVVATAIMGKPGENKGDVIDNAFVPDLALTTIQDFVNDAHGNAKGLLKGATTRIIYDLHRYQRCGQPPFAATLAREIHFNDSGGSNSPIQLSFLYSDGFGRAIQTKVQAEAGNAPQRAANVLLATGDIKPGELVRDINGNITQANSTQRWVGTGRTVYNNKGKPIKKYEPFFSSMHLYEPEPDMTDTGVTPILFYDPAERVTIILHPNHTYEKVIFDPWQQTTWDVNDTVELDPSLDNDVKGFFLDAQGNERLPKAEYIPSWYDQRKNGQLGAAEKDAAQKAAAHLATPTVAYFDMLGRTFLTVANNGKDAGGNDVFYKMRTVLDIEGNQRQVIDASDRVVMRYDYDILGNPIHQASMETGERWMLNDVAGKPMRAWDDRNFTRRIIYDALHRPTGLLVTEEPAGERLAERTVYGESQGDTNNHRTSVYQVFDGAGVVTNEFYDFKGNLQQSKRELLPNYQQAVDWLQNPSANDGTFASSTKYDALNRPTAVTAPDNSVYRPTFNEANLLDKVEVNLRGAGTATSFVTNIDYNAKGQRTFIRYAHGAETTYEYDDQTFRLIHLKTTRPAGLNGLASQLFANTTTVQDLHYTYDPVGNITNIADDAILTIPYNNEQVQAHADYIYDAIYRLIFAQGREHIGQTAFDFNLPNDNYRDYAFVGLRANPNDPKAVRNYTETYDYDEVGNIKSVRHSAQNGSWTRAYTYNEPSLLEIGKKNNRLTRTQVGNGINLPETYSYTDAQGNDIHGCMTSINLMKMTWDFKDQLQIVNLGGGGKAYYVYDASGQRVRKVIHRQNGTKQKERIYLGGFEIYREYNGTGGTMPKLERETLHIMDDKQRIALAETKTIENGNPVNDPVPLRRFHCGNHLGSASVELAEDGALISYEEYHPYGTTAFQAGRSAAEVSLKRYRYTGKERDEESGLYYHGARYYAPWLGRWISVDPTPKRVAVSPYSYCANSPICLTDPTGKVEIRKEWVNYTLDHIEAQANKGSKVGSFNLILTIAQDNFSKNDMVMGALQSREPLSLAKALEQGSASTLQAALQITQRSLAQVTELDAIWQEASRQERNLYTTSRGNFYELLRTGKSEAAQAFREVWKTIGDFDPESGLPRLRFSKVFEQSLEQAAGQRVLTQRMIAGLIDSKTWMQNAIRQNFARMAKTIDPVERVKGAWTATGAFASEWGPKALRGLGYFTAALGAANVAEKYINKEFPDSNPVRRSVNFLSMFIVATAVGLLDFALVSEDMALTGGNTYMQFALDSWQRTNASPLQIELLDASHEVNQW